MAKFPKDIFTEPDADPDTLANLGPLGGDGRDLGGAGRAPTTTRS